MNEKDKDAPRHKILSPFQRFFKMEASGGILLIICTLFALIWANSPWAENYFSLWQEKLSISFFSFSLSKPLILWINDGLMAVFFFMVGLEIKREILVGELSSLKQASLPILAAIGGMVVPATLFIIFQNGGEGSSGWGIPMATDIAFALGVLMLLGKRVPLSLKVFLTALAIIDDIGAVLVIALFYTSAIAWNALIIAGIGLAILIILNLLNIKTVGIYLFIGLIIWYQFLVSGIHPTIAGVLVAFTIPVNSKINLKDFLNRLKQEVSVLNVDEVPGHSTFLSKKMLHGIDDLEANAASVIPPAQKLEHRLHGFVMFFIMPVFAIANAGVSFGSEFLQTLTSNLTFSIIMGLVVGKSVGIFIFSWLAVKLKWASLPENTGFKHIFGIGLLAGIGFTMSLFISGLAFESTSIIDNAKIGILIASLIAGISGYIILHKSISPVSGLDDENDS